MSTEEDYADAQIAIKELLRKIETLKKDKEKLQRATDRLRDKLYSSGCETSDLRDRNRQLIKDCLRLERELNRVTGLPRIRGWSLSAGSSAPASPRPG